jgi:hypothetical protein
LYDIPGLTDLLLFFIDHSTQSLDAGFASSMSHSTANSANFKRAHDEEKVNDVLENGANNEKLYYNDNNQDDCLGDDANLTKSHSIVDDSYKNQYDKKSKQKSHKKKYVKNKSKHVPRISSSASSGDGSTDFDSAKTEELSDIFNQYCMDPSKYSIPKILLNLSNFVFFSLVQDHSQNENRNQLDYRR